MTPEYTHLFNAVSTVIRALQDTLLIQLCTYAYADAVCETDTDAALHFLLCQRKDDLAALQTLQAFLVKAQQDAEELYIGR